MSNLSERRAYKEVLTILKSLKLEDKIPADILVNMEENQDKEWEFSFEFEKTKGRRILKETASLISALYITYICEDDEEKKELRKIYEENENKD